METFSADSASKVQVLLHHGHAVGVDGTQVSVLEQTSQIALGSLLKGNQGGRLEAELGVDSIGDGADEALEGGLCKHEFDRLLVSLDFSDSDCSGSESALLLDTSLSKSGLFVCFESFADLGASSNTLLEGGGLVCYLSCNLLSGHLYRS